MWHRKKGTEGGPVTISANKQHAAFGLDSLWDEARQMGLVYLHTHDDGTYSAKIEFRTINNTTLEAKSGFRHKTPQAAIAAAIDTGHKIRESFK